MPDPASPDPVDVLLVDDNSSLAESLAVHLRSAGMAVEVVTSAAAAMRHVEDRRVGLALISSGLPGGGVALCQRVRALSGHKPKVLLLATTRPTGRALREATAAGAEGIVQKMGGPRALIARVRRALPEGETGGRPAPAPRAPAPRAPAPPLSPGAKPSPLRRKPHPHPLRARRERGRAGDGVKPFVADALANMRRKAPKEEVAAAPQFLGPSRAEREHASGVELFEADRYDEARQHFVNAYSLEPTTAIHLAYKAQCEVLLAVEPPDPEGPQGVDLRMAAMMGPELVEPQMFLGHLYFAAGDGGRARGFFKAALDLDPDHAEARSMLAKVVNET